MMRYMSLFVRMGWLALFVVTVGCGGGGGPKLVPVTGKVTVGGSAPFKKGTVRFFPKEGSKTKGGMAITDDEGKFVALHASSKKGLEPGEYVVAFSLIQMPDGSPLPDQTGVAYPKDEVALGGAEFVPAEYIGPASQKYVTTIPAKGGSFDYDISELKARPLGAKAPQRSAPNSD